MLRRLVGTLLTLSLVLGVAGGVYAQTDTPTVTVTRTQTPTITPTRVTAARTSIGLSGSTQISWQAATAHMQFTNDGHLILLVRNHDGSTPTTVTIISVADQQFGRTGDVAQVLTAATAGNVAVLGPFRTSGFNQRTSDAKGKLFVDFSSVTNVDVALVSYVQ